jgi:hypothetical protein
MARRSHGVMADTLGSDGGIVCEDLSSTLIKATGELSE